MTIVTQAAKRSLADYSRETSFAKAKSLCRVCQLAPDLRAQIKDARAREVKTRVILDWLRDEYKQELTAPDFQTHANGHHDS